LLNLPPYNKYISDLSVLNISYQIFQEHVEYMLFEISAVDYVSYHDVSQYKVQTMLPMIF